MSTGPRKRVANLSPLCPYVVFALFWYTLAYFFPRDPLEMMPLEGTFPVWLSLGRDGVWVALTLVGAVLWVRAWRASGKEIWPEPGIERRLVAVFLGTALLGTVLAFLHLSHRPPNDVLRYDVRDLLMYGSVLVLGGIWLRSSQQVRCWHKWLVANMVVVGILGYAQTYLLPRTRFEHRTYSTLSNANNFGFVMAFLLVFAIMQLDANGKWSWKWLLAIALSVGGIILCQSLALLIFLPLAFLVGILVVRHRRLVLLSLVGASLMALVTVWPSNVPRELAARVVGNVRPEPTRVSVVKRKADVERVTAELQPSMTASFWESFFFGSWTSLKLIKHEPVFFRTLRNSGALVTLGLIVVIVGSGWVGVSKGRRLRREARPQEAALLLAAGVFLLMCFFSLFVFHPFLYRFPLNFLVYTWCAVVLYYPVGGPPAQERVS